MYGRGYIVLSDLPKTHLAIDGTTVELQGGFRGFDAVPPGRHQLIWEPESAAAVSLEVNLQPNDAIVCKMQYDGPTPTRLVELAPYDSPRYWQLALSGAMGFTLYTYPAAWKTISSRSVIEEAWNQGNRLRFFMKENYGLGVDAIQSLRVAPNVVEFRTAARNFAFKLLPYAGDRFTLYLFVPSPEYPDCYDQKLDPALWMSLFEIIEDWGDFDKS
ncbi:MAG: hypothetical protein SW833_00250 [Cyanobacteriota bacterium]|nr:hypothetical protein [Cyanobacteriota bacterium]